MCGGVSKQQVARPVKYCGVAPRPHDPLRHQPWSRSVTLIHRSRIVKSSIRRNSIRCSLIWRDWIRRNRSVALNLQRALDTEAQRRDEPGSGEGVKAEESIVMFHGDHIAVRNGMRVFFCICPATHGPRRPWQRRCFYKLSRSHPRPALLREASRCPAVIAKLPLQSGDWPTMNLAQSSQN